jgi:hypothetical protein
MEPTLRYMIDLLRTKLRMSLKEASEQLRKFRRDEWAELAALLESSGDEQ